MISHRNVIANTLQIKAFETRHRESQLPLKGQSVYSDVSIGLLPQSHIYALVVICHAGPYRGDQVIVLPKFDLNVYLSAIQKFKISCLFLVSTVSSISNDQKLTLSAGPPYHHQHDPQPGHLFKV